MSLSCTELKIQFSVALATFQMLNSHTWGVATILKNKNVTYITQKVLLDSADLAICWVKGVLPVEKGGHQEYHRLSINIP